MQVLVEAEEVSGFVGRDGLEVVPALAARCFARFLVTVLASGRDRRAEYEH